MEKDIFIRSRTKPSVVGTGLIALDVVLTGNSLEARRLWAGGTCGNVLTILSYLGWRAFPVSRLNGDSASELLQQDLKKWGVCLSFAKLKPATSTPIVVERIHRTSHGEAFHRFTWICPNCGAWMPNYMAVRASAAKSIADRIKSPKIFFLDRVSRGALILATACSEKGAVVVFEPSCAGEPRLVREALEICHVLKYSHEHKKYLNEVYAAANPLLEVETLGQQGLRYRSRVSSCKTKGWQRLKAYEVSQFKDAAGAGDWCTAGIIHQIGRHGLAGLQKLADNELKDVLRFGQTLAAWNCRFEGARGGMYAVDRKTFRHDIELIMAGNGLQVPIRDKPGMVVNKLQRRICPAC